MFKLEIETGNAAFCNPFSGEADEGYEASELMNLLEKVRNELANRKKSGVIFDTNGNRVGSWSIEEEMI